MNMESVGTVDEIDGLNVPRFDEHVETYPERVLPACRWREVYKGPPFPIKGDEMSHINVKKGSSNDKDMIMIHKSKQEYKLFEQYHSRLAASQ